MKRAVPAEAEPVRVLASRYWRYAYRRSLNAGEATSEFRQLRFRLGAGNGPLGRLGGPSRKFLFDSLEYVGAQHPALRALLEPEALVHVDHRGGGKQIGGGTLAA